MSLDPLHPTLFYLPIAAHFFHEGEYEKALTAARKINTPGFAPAQAYLAAIYAELGRQSEVRFALEEMGKLWPGGTVEKWSAQLRKWNLPEENISRWAAALRKAGLPD
jgi:hypothetical protein